MRKLRNPPEIYKNNNSSMLITKEGKQKKRWENLYETLHKKW